MASCFHGWEVIIWCQSDFSRAKQLLESSAHIGICESERRPRFVFLLPRPSYRKNVSKFQYGRPSTISIFVKLFF